MSTPIGTSIAEQKCVAIVGAGMAGLNCARELLAQNDEIRVLLLEADQRVGGRIYGSTHPSFRGIDLGAEMIHGTDTILTELIDELYAEGSFDAADSNHDFVEEIFVVSHADGGPDCKPTRTGKHGMYYLDGKLLMYDDPVVLRLSSILSNIIKIEDPDSIHLDESLHHALVKSNIPPNLYALAEASYGNSAAGPMADLSLSMLTRFEKYWEENEEAGDYRLPLRIGMNGLVEALASRLQKTHSNRLKIHLGCKVKTIKQREGNSKVTVISESGEQIQADAVVVTIPPPMFDDVAMDLSPEKRKALSLIGFRRIIKICVKFKHPLWPGPTQSVISTHGLIPEMWFRDGPDGTAIAVGYITSGTADSLIERFSGEGERLSQKVIELFMEELVVIFDRDLHDFRDAYLDGLLYDWKMHPFSKGGYAYPRVGLTAKHIDDLAAPMGRIFFAGEATNTDAFCTVQAAMETGCRAATEILDFLRFPRRQPTERLVKSSYSVFPKVE